MDFSDFKLTPLTREQKQQNFMRNMMKVVRVIERNARFEGAVELKLNIAYNNKVNARKPENKTKYTDECNILYEQLNQYRAKKEAASAKLTEMVEQATNDTENFPEM